jgi:hypothetical protein
LNPNPELDQTRRLDLESNKLGASVGMSLEDQVRTHEEWQRSIDGHLDRLAAGLVAIDQKLKVTYDALAVVARNLASLGDAEQG